MQKFERFIIYPLLIISLFYSFAGEQAATTAQDIMDKLIVREISVVDDSGEEVINIGNTAVGGEILVSGRFDGYTKITNNSIGSINHNRFVFTSSDGLFIYDYEDDVSERIEKGEPFPSDFHNLVKITGVNGKGQVILNNNHGDPLIYMGENNNGHGLINIYDKYSEDWRSYGFR